MNDFITSSPDPLGTSDENFGNASTSTLKRPTISPRKPLIDTAGNARIQEIYVSTPPAKRCDSSPTKTTKQKDTQESPWRIRLTVQAERVEDDETTVSPIHLTERTTTTTVPLKLGDEGVSIEKRARGRPRKSLDNPIKRNGTPNPKAAARRKTMHETATAGPEMSWLPTPPKKGRIRGRKTLPGGPQTSSLAVNAIASPMQNPTRQTPERTIKARPFSRTRSRNRRKEVTPRKITNQVNPELEDSPSEIPSKISSSVKTRLNETSLPELLHSAEQETSHTSAQRLHSESSENATSSLERSAMDIEDEKMWRGMIRQDSVSPTGVGVVGEQAGNCIGSSDVDPTNKHQEFDTILESEGFSMVSVESLQSTNSLDGGRTGHDETPSSERSVRDGDAHSSPPTLIPQVESPLTLNSKEGISMSTGREIASQHSSFISNVPSSKLQTPESLMKMPLLPSKPTPLSLQASLRTIDEPTNGTPKIERVVRAGAALQAVPSSSEHFDDHPQHILASPFSMSKTSAALSRLTSPNFSDLETSSIARSHAPGIYDGFSAATRRELQAGLRLGEELAKRQRPRVASSDGSRDAGTSIDQTQSGPLHPQLSKLEPNEVSNVGRITSEEDTVYPLFTNNQLPSPQTSDFGEAEYQTGWKANTPVKMQNTSSVTTSRPDDTIDYAMLAKEAEWQREREAVSKQIQEANSSQVIVIDSEDEDSRKYNSPDSFQRLSNEDEMKLPSMESPEMSIRPSTSKPRRSKLPSPWRVDPGGLYNDEIQQDDSDLFWQPDHAHAEAAKKRQERKKKTQTSQDSPRMSTTDSTARGDSVSSIHIPGTPISITDKVLHTEDTSLLAILRTPGGDEDSDYDDTYYEESEKESDNESEYMTEDSTEDMTDDCIQPTEELLASETSISFAHDESAASVPLPDSPTLTPIDPQLLVSATKAKHPLEMERFQDDKSIEASGSWFSMLTGPFTSLFQPRFSLPPMTEFEILTCTRPDPLSLFQPWTPAHAYALKCLIHVSVFYTAELLPYNPRSKSAYLLGATVTSLGGWARKITKGDCGVIDAFMLLMRHRAIPPEKGWYSGVHIPTPISTREIAMRLVEYWVSMVMTGSVRKADWKGVKVGLRKRGDRMWTGGDIDWENNMNAYFDEKRALIEKYGLPSWAAKGLEGPFKLPLRYVGLTKERI